MANWRKNIDPLLREHLEAQIRETIKHKKALQSAENKGNAQLWVAIANLSKQIFDLNLQSKVLERALQGSLKKKARKNKIETKKILKSLKKF